MKLSVCMIVKNEEANIIQALKSTQGVHEVIVVDTGSSDRTVELAEAWGAKVYFYEWNESFSDARNYAASKASGQYIAMLDADECLSDHFFVNIGKHFERYNDVPAAIIIQNENDQESTRHRAVRVYPNLERFCFDGDVHEQLFDSVSGDLAESQDCDALIYHYGYQSKQYENKGKYERYLALYDKAIKDNPYNGYMHYQLGKLYYSNEKYAEAYHAFSRSAELAEMNRFYYPVMLVQLGYTLKHLGYSKEAYQLLEPLADQYPNYPDLAFLLGTLAMDIGKLDRIEHYYKEALNIGDTDKYSTIVGNGSFRAAYNLGVFYEVTGNKEQAQFYYRLAAKSGFQPSIDRLLVIS
ncbi:tetratricopeptide repeat-containing glycosyltransferase family 2 protein [Paenibacillus harenae]|uniref:tetratricopeptide repeat-containing glycosyltransferase family 2 protein n=1 Tax=Paenibacillus harenae TaxID=306543 RepID=UPI002790C3D8|nr:glycosyltransferase [Paenibacillus harenae]MDQ0062041.1 glycosyltransferase involved in cell wall biosynthesis [Paenibacillus harenae]